MPETRLKKTRDTLPEGYQFGQGLKVRTVRLQECPAVHVIRYDVIQDVMVCVYCAETFTPNSWTRQRKVRGHVGR